MRRLRWSHLALLVLLVAACPFHATKVSKEDRLMIKNEILLLDRELSADREALGLTPWPASKWLSAVKNKPVDFTPVKRQSESNVCIDVCDYAQSICRAQAEICTLASKLGDDEWSRGKCTKAKASCKEAKQRCTDCR